MQYHSQACASTPWGTRQGQPHPKPSPYSGWEKHDSLKRTHSHAKPLFWSKICPFIVPPEVLRAAADPHFWSDKMHNFLVVFQILLRHLKKRFKSRQDPAQEPLGANLCDFPRQLGPPKPSQSPVFCASKTHFILKCPKPQNLMIVLHLDHILLLQNLPKTLPKSFKNRC